MTPPAHDASVTVPAGIDAALEAFTQGAATRDTDRVCDALLPEACQFVVTPAGLRVIARDAYVAGLAAGAIGGAPTTRVVDAVHVDGHRAWVRQVRTAGATRLRDAVSLVDIDGTWKIASVCVEIGA